MWAYIGVAWLLGAAIASQQGWAATESATAGGIVALLTYLALCWFRPYKPCPSCRGDDRDRDGEGNYRRFTCWRCQGAKDYPRIGARLMGKGRDR